MEGDDMATIHLKVHHIYKQSFLHAIDQNKFELNFIQNNGRKNCLLNYDVEQLSLIESPFHLRRDLIDNMPEPFIMFGTLKQLYLLIEFQKKLCGFITPEDSLDELSESILHALNGGCILSSCVKKFLKMDEFLRQKKLLKNNLLKLLTKSELEILYEISKGNTNSFIAKKRYRSIHTVKTQRKKIRWKLQLNNKQKLMIFAAQKTEQIHTILTIRNNWEKLRKLMKNTPIGV